MTHQSERTNSRLKPRYPRLQLMQRRRQQETELRKLKPFSIA